MGDLLTKKTTDESDEDLPEDVENLNLVMIHTGRRGAHLPQLGQFQNKNVCAKLFILFKNLIKTSVAETSPEDHA